MSNTTMVAGPRPQYSRLGRTAVRTSLPKTQGRTGFFRRPAARRTTLGESHLLTVDDLLPGPLDLVERCS
ncbi:hypothetical protein [Streptomyces sp. NPDC058155]|uniref:hypothetical protein n=1 Tax=Streptomyces sp. NPDC058155 TaxID=3346359 RepID=UPI0036E99FF1